MRGTTTRAAEAGADEVGEVQAADLVGAAPEEGRDDDADRDERGEEREADEPERGTGS